MLETEEQLLDSVEKIMSQEHKSTVVEWLATQDSSLRVKRVFLQEWAYKHGRGLTKADYRAVKEGKTLFGKKPN